MAFATIVALILLFLVAPIVVVVATAFGTSPYPVFPPVGFTMKWFAKVWNTPEVLEAARLSATLAACTSALATIIGTLSALALVRFRIRARPLVSSVLMSPILFPAIVLGLALLVFYHRVGLAGTFAGLAAAHVLLTTPFVLRLVMASLAEFDPTIEEAARNLGAGALRTFLLVTLPLIRPGVIAGGLFAFILSFDELVVTLFLAGPGKQTLPIRIFTYVEYSSDPSISAISACLIVLWFVIGVPVYRRYLTVRH
jgi:putative spermidine/putrescine transport system permease protein